MGLLNDRLARYGARTTLDVIGVLEALGAPRSVGPPSNSISILHGQQIMTTPSPFRFELLHDAQPTSASKQTGRQRRGILHTPRGDIQTPAFMPVGTRATVKGLLPRDLDATGSEICLANTYHLHIAPGEDVVGKIGGLHKFMGWDKPVLTDSGGFQVFSLPKMELDEEGVTFHYRKSGKPVQLTPELSMAIQQRLGADIAMAFDVCVPYPCDKPRAEEAVHRTARWLKRCIQAHHRPDQALFGIVQGSVYPDLRKLSAELTTALDLPGFAIGGVSVGEGHSLMMDVVEATEPSMPRDKPRYLMGVGLPEDLVEAVYRGIDMFDCVLPSRLGRSGVIFTRRGRIRITKGRYKRDKYPLDTNCQCIACTQFSRAYVHHLIQSREILGSTLATLHNITFYQDLMRAMRMAIEDRTFDAFRRAFLDEYLSDDRKEELDLHVVSTRIDDEALDWDTEHSVVPPKNAEARVAMEKHASRNHTKSTKRPGKSTRSKGSKKSPKKTRRKK